MNTTTQVGASPLFLLFLLFLGFKLGGVITWSWWWVTAPLWGGLALVFGVAVMAGFAWLLVLLYVHIFDR